jgi:hypothetical protein
LGPALAAGAALIACAAATAAGFPDVPPWHWAYDAVTRDQDAGVIVGYPASPGALIENAVTQVYDGFAHASATGAQAWVERFSYNLPQDWPSPFQRSQIVAFSFTGMRVSTNGNTAEAAFTTIVGTRGGQASTARMRVGLHFNGLDWQVDYAALARASALFR